MAGKVTFIILGARSARQHKRQQRAYQGLLKAKRQLREIEEGEKITQYHRNIHQFLAKFNFFDDIDVMSHMIWSNIIAE